MLPARRPVSSGSHWRKASPFGADGAGNVRVSTANLRLSCTTALVPFPYDAACAKELRQEEEQQQLRGWAWRCPSSSEGAGRRERAAGAGGGACRAADRPEGGKAQQEDVRQRKPAGMNEATWQRVAQWEMLHRGECDTPTVLRFQAKPHDLSSRLPPAAERAARCAHDWVICCFGEEVRYNIQLYFVDNMAGTLQAFAIGARPAMDSVEAALDRVKMNIYLPQVRGLGAALPHYRSAGRNGAGGGVWRPAGGQRQLVKAALLD
eukprot:XP_001696883.1 cytochrome c heme lyase [Chlamydomonas reinhardtii]